MLADGTEDAGVDVADLAKVLRVAAERLAKEQAETLKEVQRTLDKYDITVPEVKAEPP